MAQKSVAAKSANKAKKPVAGKTVKPSKTKGVKAVAAKAGKTPAKPVSPLPAAASVKTGRRQVETAKQALKAEVKAAATPRVAKTRGRKGAVDISANESASDLLQKWNTLYKKAEQIDSKPYNMKSAFEEKTAIVHKLLGWGYILANRNDRLEVLFKDGIKYLISNYKP